MLNYKNNIIVLISAFVVISIILPFAVVYICIGDSGKAEASIACKSLFFLTNWPSILLKIYPFTTDMNGEKVFDVAGSFFDFRVIVINFFGWCFLGFSLYAFFKIKKDLKGRL
jgi:hypothetical protein